MKIYLYKNYNDGLAYGEEYTKIFSNKDNAKKLLNMHLVETYGMPLKKMMVSPEFINDVCDEDYVAIRNDAGDVSYFIIEEKDIDIPKTFLLIECMEGDIETSKYGSFEEAYKAMEERYTEVSEYAVPDDCEILDKEAWVYDGPNHDNYTWKIVEL